MVVVDALKYYENRKNKSPISNLTFTFPGLGLEGRAGLEKEGRWTRLSPLLHLGAIPFHCIGASDTCLGGSNWILGTPSRDYFHIHPTSKPRLCFTL